jgi:hypothetical protein
MTDNQRIPKYGILSFNEWKIKESFDRNLALDILEKTACYIRRDENDEYDKPHKYSGQVYGLVGALRQVLLEPNIEEEIK